MDTRLQAGGQFLILSIILLLSGPTINAFNITIGAGLSGQSNNSTHTNINNNKNNNKNNTAVVAKPVVELMASGALDLGEAGDQPLPAFEFENVADARDEIEMQAAYSDPYTPWLNEVDVGDDGPHSLSTVQQPAIAGGAPYNYIPPIPSVNYQFPPSFDQHKHQRQSFDQHRPVRYASDVSYSSPVEADLSIVPPVKYGTSALKQETEKSNLPSLKSSFLKDVLDYLFQNKTRMANSYSYGQQQQQQPVDHYHPVQGQLATIGEESIVESQPNPSQWQFTVDGTGPVAPAGETFPYTSNTAKRFTTAKDVEMAANDGSMGNVLKPSAQTPSPLLLKHLDNLENMLKLEDSPDGQFILKKDLLNELSLPVLIKPIIITVPDAPSAPAGVGGGSGDGGGGVSGGEQIVSEMGNVARNIVQRASADQQTVNAEVEPISGEETGAKVDYNVIQIPSSKNGAPNTYHVYGKHNFLIVQNENVNSSTKAQDLVEGDDGQGQANARGNVVEPYGSMVKTRQISIDDFINPRNQETNQLLENVKNCDCEVKCRSCKGLVDDAAGETMLGGISIRDNNNMMTNTNAIRRSAEPNYVASERQPMSSPYSNRHSRQQGSMDMYVDTRRRAPPPSPPSYSSHAAARRQANNIPPPEPMLSFDVPAESPSAEITNEYSDLDFLVADAAKYLVKDGQLFNDDNNHDHDRLLLGPEDVDDDNDDPPGFDQESLKSYFESLNTRLLESAKVRMAAKQSGASASRAQEATERGMQDSDNLVKTLGETEEHNIVKKYLSPDEVPPLHHVTLY